MSESPAIVARVDSLGYHRPMDKVSLADKFARISDHWHPRIVGELNGQHVKLVKFKGETWERFESPYEGSFYGLHELASGRLLAHGLRGHVYVSDDRGATWTSAAIEVDGLIATAAEVAPGTVVVSGAGGKLFISRDGGSNFSTGPATSLNATAELLGTAAGVISVGDSGVRVTALPQP